MRRPFSLRRALVSLLSKYSGESTARRRGQSPQGEAATSEKPGRSRARAGNHLPGKNDQLTAFASTTSFSSAFWLAISMRRGFSASGTSRSRSICSIPSAWVAPVTFT